MPHYYSEEQTSGFHIKKLNIKVGLDTFPMLSAPGVFSKKRLDKGTAVLLKYFIIENGWKVLDLGCGFGVIGVYVKRTYPDCEIVMSDVNRRATTLARKNLKLNNLKGKVISSDGFVKIKADFNTIILNPPQSAGKAVCFGLITYSIDHLKIGGSLQIVARHNKGGKVLSGKMREVFGNVEEIGKGSGFRVYFSRKKS